MRWALTTIRLSAACRNTSVSRATGMAPELMTSARTCPGPTEGSWSTSPTSSKAAFGGNRLQQGEHQRRVDHAGLVDDEEIAIERVVGVALEAAVLGIGLEQPMDGLRLDAGLLGHALGGAAGGRREQDFRSLGGDDAQDGVEQRRLADAGAAGDDGNLRPRGPSRSRRAATAPASCPSSSRPTEWPCRRRSPAMAAPRAQRAAAGRRCRARRDKAPAGRRRVAPRSCPRRLRRRQAHGPAPRRRCRRRLRAASSRA